MLTCPKQYGAELHSLESATLPSAEPLGASRTNNITKDKTKNEWVN